jgi:hypothetical protein
MRDVFSPINRKSGPAVSSPSKLIKVKHAPIYEGGGPSKLSSGGPRPSPGDPDPFRYLTGSISVTKG